MAFYCEPTYPDHGAVSGGWRGHGGLMLDGVSCNLLPQYNLEAAWKRRLSPVSGFDEGLLLPRTDKPVLLRPPGHLRYDQAVETMRNRNLICAKAESDELDFWVVSERSQRNSLEQYRAKVCSKGEDAAEWRLKSDEWLVQRTGFDESISEIRCSSHEGLTVLCRGRQNLYGVSVTGEAEPVFKGVVRSFEENPILAGDIAILGANGMLWSGTMGESLARTKSGGEHHLKLLTHSDHPRVLAVASDLEVRTFDLRSDVNATTLFSCPSFADHPEGDVSLHGEKLPTPQLTHLRSFPHNLHNLVAVTTHCVYLLDDRYPGRPVLSNKHAILNGPSVFLPATEAVKDTKGSIHSIYFLDHFCTGVWVMELFKHNSIDTWSSVRPLHGLGDPNDTKNVPKPLAKGVPVDVFEPSRGIAVVNGVSCGRKPVEVLLRCHDDGTVTYRSFFHGQEGEEVKRRVGERTMARNIRFAKKLRKFKERANAAFGPELTKPAEQHCQIIDVEVSFPSASSSFDLRYPLNPLRKQISPGAVVLEPLVPKHKDAFLSNAVNSHWVNLPNR